MTRSKTKNIFLLLSLFVTVQVIIPAENASITQTTGNTPPKTLSNDIYTTPNPYHTVATVIATTTIEWGFYWLWKYCTNSGTTAPEPKNHNPIGNTTIVPLEREDILNAQIAELMTVVYENPSNTIAAFELVQKLKVEAETKQYTPAALTLIQETLEQDPNLTTYAAALEHLNALVAGARQEIDPIEIENKPKAVAYQINKSLPTKDQITALKNNMYANVTKEDTQAYTETLTLLKQRPKNKDPYTDKILDALLECLTGGNKDKTDLTFLTLARYNKCEHAAQVQYAATNS